MSKLKLRVAVPHYWPREMGGISQATERGLAELNSCAQWQVEGLVGCGSRLARARNRFVRHPDAQNYSKDTAKLNFDYILFVDSDTGFTAKNVEQLLSHKKDIICGAYPYKQDYADRYVAGMWNHVKGCISERLTRTTKGLQPVDWIGAGMTLINERVFKNIEFPYFRETIVHDGEKRIMVGEDMGFCLQCEAVGIERWVDCDMNPPIRHIPFNQFLTREGSMLLENKKVITYDFSEAVALLKRKPLPAAVAWEFGDLFTAIAKQQEKFRNARKEIMERFDAPKDKRGNLGFDDEHLAPPECVAEMTELMNCGAEYDFDPVALPEKTSAGNPIDYEPVITEQLRPFIAPPTGVRAKKPKQEETAE